LGGGETKGDPKKQSFLDEEMRIGDRFVQTVLGRIISTIGPGFLGRKIGQGKRIKVIRQEAITRSS